jgi:hypothetical protein
LRHRLGLACGVLVVGLVSIASGCGDDEPPPDQTAFFLGLSQANNARCTQSRSFGVPDPANPLTARNVVFGDGNRDVRLEDGGDHLVECRVAQSGGTYQMSLEISSGEIGNLGVSGTAVSGVGGANLSVNFQTQNFFLGQEGCTGDVQFVGAGALWVNNLNCPTLTDPSSPGVSCVGSGGFIIENCSD